ncbi:MAG: helix-hairpin-helix domain-containing protein [Calditrichaeota bacterium]|nr:MAG: helix-hairpin-helix domain-containing protein [Calditrichota bacterium]
MGGFSRQQTLVLAIMLVLYLAGLAFNEWIIEPKDAPEVDKKELERFIAISDSLNAITHKLEYRNTKKKKRLSSKININSATATTLLQLPGIGKVIAQRIIDYREQNGYFTSENQLKKVKGIGEKKFLLIKENIVLH